MKPDGEGVKPDGEGVIRMESRSRPLPVWEGEPTEVWAGRWGVPRFEVWSALPSTNDRVRERAREEGASWTTVVAEEQTAGRGRGGRPWSSPPGLGLWLSTLVHATGPDARAVLPLRAGLALVRAVEASAGLGAGIKWPNDLLVEGRKVAGILCETARPDGGVVVGVGVNVRQEPRHFPPGLRERAASLEQLGDRPVSRAALAGAFLAELRALVRDGPGELDGPEIAALAERDLLAGRRVVLSTGIRGECRGVGPDGTLLLEDAGRLQRAVAGSVSRIEPPLTEPPLTEPAPS